MIYQYKNLIQLRRLTDNIPNADPIPVDESEAINYLYFLDRTFFDNGYSLDLINYEKLIYIEFTYPFNQKIQQLIKNIKQNIANNFSLKYKYIQRLTDNMCSDIITKEYKQSLQDWDKDMMIRGYKDFEYSI